MKKQSMLVCLFATLIFQACDEEAIISKKEPVQKNAAMQQERQTEKKDFTGTFYIGDRTYTVDQDLIKYYKKDTLQFAFEVVGLAYAIQEEKNTFFIENLNNQGEYIKIHHIEKYPGGNLIFDVTNSEGGTLENINVSGVACIQCWIDGAAMVLTAMWEITGGGEQQEGVPAACADAVAAMAPYCDGRIVFDLEVEESWFGTDCHVECVPW